MGVEPDLILKRTRLQFLTETEYFSSRQFSSIWMGEKANQIPSLHQSLG
jgi:hypothetical protein